MARGKTHIVRHRRRREGKTDYRARLSLLKSKKPRFVVRKSSKNITCQLVGYGPKGDNVIAASDSRSLKSYGWNGHCGNISAAYLTGLLCGAKATKAGIKEAVLDMGLYKSVKGSRIYAALKGAVDSGLNVAHSEGVLPPQDRIEGRHTKESEKTTKEFRAAMGKIAPGISVKPVKPDTEPATEKPETKPDTPAKPVTKEAEQKQDKDQSKDQDKGKDQDKDQSKDPAKGK